MAGDGAKAGAGAEIFFFEQRWSRKGAGAENK